MKRNSNEWSKLFGVLVTDPDGWNRQNFDASWAEEITEEEFKERLQRSTSLVIAAPVSIGEIRELVDLMNAYGEAKFGDEWWPGNAAAHIGDEKAERLLTLLECVAG